MWRSGLLVLMLLSNRGAAAAAECAKNKQVVASCYQVRGRVRFNANMRPYLWPVGTKRLLGVALQSDAPDAGYFWPDNLAKMTSLETDVFGDFLVCPFTSKKPGRMQMVCIESASHLIAKPNIH